MTYDYYCPNCNFEKEEIHGMTETPEIICEKCNTKMRRAFKKLTYKLNGYGWASVNSGIEPMKQTTKYYGKKKEGVEPS